VYIIGAGPGGLAAAHYLQSKNVNFTIFERGSSEPANFYQFPIALTYHGRFLETNNEYKYYPLANSLPFLAQMIGGTQNVNGGIYSPGSAEDIARSANVALNDSRRALDFVNTIMESRKIGDFMWAPGLNGYDFGTTAAANERMERRSLAYNLSSDIRARIQTNRRVIELRSREIDFGSTEIITLTPKDRVILAAGALTSPQLIRQTKFCGWNHYFNTSFSNSNPPILNQSISYDRTTRIETNIAAISGMGPDVNTVTIEMLMEHGIKECFEVGQEYNHNSAFGSDPWHYAGTIRSDRTQISDNVFSGDASLFQTPFNCHTSGAASVAGVLAAMRILGELEEPQQNNLSGLDGLTKVGVWYAVGAFLIIIAIIAHVFSFWNTHYVLATAGVVAITVGVATSHNGYVKNNNSGHYYVGYVALGWLWAQAIFGYILTRIPGETKKKYGWLHRVSAILLFILLIYLFATVALKESPFSEMKDIDAWSIVAWTLFVLFILLVLVVLWRLRNRLANVKITGYNLLNHM